MARLTLLAILFALLTVAGAQSTCEYIRSDASTNCFDSVYTCESCCTTDRGLNSGFCWTGVYVKSRCCKDNIPAAPAAPAAPATPAAPAAPPVETAAPKSLVPVPTEKPSPTAQPTPSPTPPPTVYVCPYEKDKSLKCFDDNYYTCKSCCTTGLSEKTFVSCWNYEFTEERCCQSPSSITSSPDTPAAPAQPPVCIYDKDQTCWDAQYTCESCCLTDKSNGFNCWSAGYTKSRCCRSGAAGVQFQEIPPHVYTAPPVASPASSCPYNKDAECWGGIYICEQCCTTGQSSFGTSCFDATYTRERCCSNYVKPPPATPPTNNVAPPAAPSAATANCPYNAGVAGCFTDLYPCSSCCVTGLDLSGTTSCWDATFNAARCCVAAATPAAPATPATPVSPPVSTGGACQDTLDVCSVWATIGECNGAAAAYVKDVCKASCNSCSGRRSMPSTWSGEKDTRGLPIDSRGNPILPTRYVRVPAQARKEEKSGNPDSSLLVLGLAGAGVAVLAAAVMLVVYRHRKTATPAVAMSNHRTTAAPPNGVGTRPWRSASRDEGSVAV